MWCDVMCVVTTYLVPKVLPGQGGISWESNNLQADNWLPSEHAAGDQVTGAMRN